MEIIRGPSGNTDARITIMNNLKMLGKKSEITVECEDAANWETDSVSETALNHTGTIACLYN